MNNALACCHFFVILPNPLLALPSVVSILGQSPQRFQADIVQVNRIEVIWDGILLLKSFIIIFLEHISLINEKKIRLKNISI